MAPKPVLSFREGVVTNELVTDWYTCGTHMRVCHAWWKLDYNKSRHTIVLLSHAIRYNSNTLSLQNILQSWDISYVIDEDIFYLMSYNLLILSRLSIHAHDMNQRGWTVLWKHFKLIILESSCLLQKYALGFKVRSTGTKHRDTYSGLYRRWEVTVWRFWEALETCADPSQLWGDSFQKNILEKQGKGDFAHLQ